MIASVRIIFVGLSIVAGVGCATESPRLRAGDALEECGRANPQFCQKEWAECEKYAPHRECNDAFWAGHTNGRKTPEMLARPYRACESDSECVVVPSWGRELADRDPCGWLPINRKEERAFEKMARSHRTDFLRELEEMSSRERAREAGTRESCAIIIDEFQNPCPVYCPRSTDPVRCNRGRCEWTRQVLCM